MGSKTTSPANVRGRSRSAMSRAVPPIEWPKPIACSSPSASHTARTSAVKRSQSPRSVVGRSDDPWPRWSMAQQWKRSDRAAARGREDVAVEPGGVGQQQRRSVAAEVVDGQAQTVGGGHEHPAMIVGGGWTRQDRPLA